MALEITLTQRLIPQRRPMTAALDCASPFMIG
jgi:hypothetical protein